MYRSGQSKAGYCPRDKMYFTVGTTCLSALLLLTDRT